MPKRKISDLGPNECIHCPTKESRAIVLKMFQTHRKEGWHSFTMSSDYIEDVILSRVLDKQVGFETAGILHINWFREKGYTIYPRKDFLDEEEEVIRHPKIDIQARKKGDMYEIDQFVNRDKKSQAVCLLSKEQLESFGFFEKNITDTTPVRPGPFKTGDEVEVSPCGLDWHPGNFVGYTTDCTYLITRVGSPIIFYYTHCRLPLQKQQHTISCTDEVLEKVKQIDGVYFIL